MQAGAWHDVTIQRAAVQALLELLSFGTEINGMQALPVVMGAMAVHPEDVRVQYVGFSFLTQLASKATANRQWCMALLGAASSTATAMKVGRGNESMQRDGCRLIQMLAEAARSDDGAAKDAILKSEYEKKVNTAPSAVQPLKSLEELKSAMKGPKAASYEVALRFTQTVQEVVNAIYEAFRSPPEKLPRISKKSKKIVSKS